MLVEDRLTGRAVGTYRVQTAAAAEAGQGFYSATEFDLSTLPGEVLDDLLVVTPRNRLLDELPELLLDELRVLLADRLSEDVGFGERDAGKHLGDTHHLLLIGDDAVGGLEDRLQLRERVDDRLLAAFSLLVDAMHPGVERAGAHERVRRHEVVEPVTPHGAEHVRGERRLELEHAGRAAGAQHPVDLRVVVA